MTRLVRILVVLAVLAVPSGALAASTSGHCGSPCELIERVHVSNVTASSATLEVAFRGEAEYQLRLGRPKTFPRCHHKVCEPPSYRVLAEGVTSGGVVTVEVSSLMAKERYEVVAQAWPPGTTGSGLYSAGVVKFRTKK